MELTVCADGWTEGRPDGATVDETEAMVEPIVYHEGLYFNLKAGDHNGPFRGEILTHPSLDFRLLSGFGIWILDFGSDVVYLNSLMLQQCQRHYESDGHDREQA